MNEFDDLLKEMLGANYPEEPSGDDDEAWLLQVADDVLKRRAEPNPTPSTPTDQAIYCFWVIDYAVRNSGTLEPMRELYPDAITEFTTFARENALPQLTKFLTSYADEKTFCETYHDTFPAVCAEFRAQISREASLD